MRKLQKYLFAYAATFKLLGWLDVTWTALIVGHASAWLVFGFVENQDRFRTRLVARAAHARRAADAVRAIY